MPPSAAPEWLRVGCSFETTATSAPASWAAIAARMPAQPAPLTRTSWLPSTEKGRYRKPRRDGVSSGTKPQHLTAWCLSPTAHRPPGLPGNHASRPATSPGRCTSRDRHRLSVSDPRAGGCERRVGGRELAEVLHEQLCELRRLEVVLLRVGPGRARIEQRGLHTGRLDRHLEAEDRIHAVLDVVERTGERRVQQRPCGGDRHPLALP